MKKTVIFKLLVCLLVFGLIFTGCEEDDFPPVSLKTPGGELVDYSNLQEALDSIVAAGAYHITIYESQIIKPFTVGSGIELNIGGAESVVTIELESKGSLFIVSGILNLSKNVTLLGLDDNTSALVTVSTSGEFTMANTTTITGNSNTGNGGGVRVNTGGTFKMFGGTISENAVVGSGGTGSNGGGVSNAGTFTMSGGTIIGNEAIGSTASEGGGVSNTGSFTMTGGTITGNKTRQAGGGVYNSHSATFVKSGSSIITGKGDSSGNLVVSADNVEKDGFGHAVYNDIIGAVTKRDSTAGTGVNLDKATSNNWE